LLLTSTERDFLLGNREFTKTQQRYLRCRLNKKVKEFVSNELTILKDKGYIVGTIAASSNAAAKSCNAALRNGQQRSDVNIMFESDAHTETELDSGSERGSPSLVGRGIANPMSERTRGFEMLPSPPQRGEGSTSIPLPALFSFVFIF
jgi:hypothetical protein